jgi:CHAP domain
MSTKSLTDPAVRAALRSEIVKVAFAELGYIERTGNNTKYGEWFGLNRNPWCCMFVSWVYQKASDNVGCVNPLAGLQTRRGFAGTILGFAKAKAKGLVVRRGEPVLPGDVIIWRHTPVTGHTGVVTQVHSDGSFSVTEGNTSDRDTSSRNGGMVATHRHTLSDGQHGVLLGVVRPSRVVYKPSGV